MLNPEERRGLQWVGAFLLVLLGVGSVIISLRIPAAEPAPGKVHARDVLGLGSLQALVVDAESRQPISRKDLSLEVAGLEGRSDHWLELEDRRRPGWIVIRGLPAGLDFRLRVESQDFAPLITSARVEPQGLTTLEPLSLRPLLPIRGRIVDPAGEGLSGRSIELSELEGSNGCTLITAQDGSWNTEPLPCGNYALRLQSGEDFLDPLPPIRLTTVPSSPESKLHPRTIVGEASPGVPLRGRIEVSGGTLPDAIHCLEQSQPVNDDGRFEFALIPASRAELRIEGERGEVTYVSCLPPQSELSIPLPVERAFTIQVQALQPGPFWVAARSLSDSHRSRTRLCSTCFVACDSLPSDGRIALSIRPFGKIEILVLDANGGHAELEIASSDDPFREPIPLQIRSSAASLLCAGPCQVELLPIPWQSSAPPLVELAPHSRLAVLASHRAQIHSTYDGATPREVRGSILSLASRSAAEPARTVRGEVVDELGIPVAEARVVAWLVPASPPQETALPIATHAHFTDLEGRFSILVPQGARAVLMDVQGGPNCAALERVDQESLQRVTLSAGASVEATIRDAEGRAVPGAGLELVRPRPAALEDLALEDAQWQKILTLRRISNRAGRVQFNALIPGHCTGLSLEHGSLYAELPEFLDVPTGSHVALEDVVCRSRVRARGRIVDEDGAPLAGASIQIIDSSRETWTDVSDENGSFELEDLPPVPSRLEVQLAGFRTALHDKLHPDALGTPIVLQRQRQP